MIMNYNQGTSELLKISENFPNSLEGKDFYIFKYKLSPELKIKILKQIKSSILKTYKLFRNNYEEIIKKFYEIAKGRNVADKNEQFDILLGFIGGNLISKTDR